MDVICVSLHVKRNQYPGSEFVIDYDGEFANNTLVTINLLGGATR